MLSEPSVYFANCNSLQRIDAASGSNAITNLLLSIPAWKTKPIGGKLINNPKFIWKSEKSEDITLIKQNLPRKMRVGQLYSYFPWREFPSLRIKVIKRFQVKVCVWWCNTILILNITIAAHKIINKYFTFWCERICKNIFLKNHEIQKLCSKDIVNFFSIT